MVEVAVAQRQQPRRGRRAALPAAPRQQCQQASDLPGGGVLQEAAADDGNTWRWGWRVARVGLLPRSNPRGAYACRSNGEGANPPNATSPQGGSTRKLWSAPPTAGVQLEGPQCRCPRYWVARRRRPPVSQPQPAGGEQPLPGRLVEHQSSRHVPRQDAPPRDRTTSAAAADPVCCGPQRGRKLCGPRAARDQDDGGPTVGGALHRSRQGGQVLEEGGAQAVAAPAGLAERPQESVDASGVQAVQRAAVDPAARMCLQHAGRPAGARPA